MSPGLDATSLAAAGRGPRRLARATAGALGVLCGALVPLAGYVALRADPRTAPTASAPAPPVVHAICDPPGPSTAPPSARCEEVLALLGGVRAGTTVDRWRVVRIQDAPEGAFSVELAGTSGFPFTVEVRRRDEAAPRAPAETEALSLYVARVARGTATPEDHGLGARALAARLRGAGRAAPAWLRPLGDGAAPAAGGPR